MLDERALAASLKSGPGRFYAIASQDEYLARKAVRLITDSAESECETIRISAGQDLSAVEDNFNSAALFGGGMIVYLFNADSLSELSAADRQQLSELLRDIPEHIIFIMTAMADSRRPAMPKELEKLCGEAGGTAVLITARQGEALLSEIELIAKECGATIERGAAKILVERCGSSLALIYNEVVKAAAYCNYGAITPADVKLLTPEPADAGVFDIIRAAGAGNTGAALTALGRLLQNKEEPIAIAAALNSNYINYYRALLVKKRGGKLDDLYSLYGYRKNDVKPKIAFERCGSYTIARLEKIIATLYKLDGDLKSSRASGALLLETAMAKILTI